MNLLLNFEKILFKDTSIGGVSIQLSLALRAMSAGLKSKFSSSSSSSAEKNQDMMVVDDEILYAISRVRLSTARLGYNVAFIVVMFCTFETAMLSTVYNITFYGITIVAWADVQVASAKPTPTSRVSLLVREKEKEIYRRRPR